MLSSNLDQSQKPYFLWDDNLSWSQLRSILSEPLHPQFAYYLGKVLREADFKDVWNLVSVGVVATYFQQTVPFLGRRREYWLFLISGWRRLGLLKG